MKMGQFDYRQWRKQYILLEKHAWIALLLIDTGLLVFE